MLLSLFSYDEYFGRTTKKYNFIIKEKEKEKYNQTIFKKILCNSCKKNHLQIIELVYNLYKKESKMNMLDNVLTNIFLLQEQKDEFLRVFSITQKTLFALSRFIHIIKYKKANFNNNVDLFGEPFTHVKQYNIITIFENNTKYTFSIQELINILNSALSNSVHFFGEPIACKNPYTNIPFKKSSLYNIYFKIKSSSFIMPILLHQFFLANFDLTTYMEENESLIRKFFIESYTKNISAKNVYSITIGMYKELYIRCGIHRDFPKEELLKIMHPYIQLYYKGKYSFEENKCKEYMHKLKLKLIEFIRYNSNFGRKKVVYKYNIFTKKKEIDKIVFNRQYIDFEKKENNESFLKSHLILHENLLNIHYPEYSEDYETDSEEEEESDSNMVSQYAIHNNIIVDNGYQPISEENQEEHSVTEYYNNDSDNETDADSESESDSDTESFSENEDENEEIVIYGS